VIDVRELAPEEVDLVGAHLPLSRLPTASTYLIAWEGDRPVGHAHLAWTNTHLGMPEIQDVFVLPERRRRGIASKLTEAAEQRALAAGRRSVSLSVSEGNGSARSLYEKLGYVDAGVEPVHVSGVIELRSGPIEVDDTLIYLTKALSDTMGA
jgi:GNAT superfamily N-acetyltransferase